ncbi:MAG: hypothetical protein HY741_16075 [Chloroflexi bacterium]|nr:hypothetical protein [Chloroflexota bacterium]MBI4761730.1 hypothetical protein [Chloroflexota bacterium]
MNTPNTTTFRLTVYSTEFLWQGELALAAHRRLSDFVNDVDQQFLELARVKTACWENNAYRILASPETAIVFKHNIVLVVVSEDALSAAAADRAADRVSKVPQRVRIQAPPLVVEGNLHTPSMVDWSRAINVTRSEFVPLTGASVWHSKSHVLLGTDIKLALVHRSAIHSVQNVKT